MTISIITATFNSGKTLRTNLESVLSQTFGDFEHIIVDGASRDDTMEIVKAYEPLYRGRLRYVSEPDKGIYDAMNKGIAMATGDVIGVLNSDDCFASDKILEAVANGMTKVDAVFGDLDYVGQNDLSRVVRRWKGSPFVQGYFFKGWHPAHPTFYARRECFEKYGNFDLTLNVSADFELMFRFMERYKIRTRYIPETFVKMRMGGESNRSLSKIIEGNRNILKAFRKNGYDAPRFYVVRRLAPKVVSMVRTSLKRRKS